MKKFGLQKEQIDKIKDAFLPPIQEYNEDGTEKHIVQEGARFHVISWDTEGSHCSNPNCEINKR